MSRTLWQRKSESLQTYLYVDVELMGIDEELTVRATQRRRQPNQARLEDQISRLRQRRSLAHLADNLIMARPTTAVVKYPKPSSNLENRGSSACQGFPLRDRLLPGPVETTFPLGTCG